MAPDLRSPACLFLSGPFCTHLVSVSKQGRSVLDSAQGGGEGCSMDVRWSHSPHGWTGHVCECHGCRNRDLHSLLQAHGVIPVLLPKPQVHFEPVSAPFQSLHFPVRRREARHCMLGHAREQSGAGVRRRVRRDSGHVLFGCAPCISR